MRILRHRGPGGEPRVAVEHDGMLHPVGRHDGIAGLLRLDGEALRAALESALAGPGEPAAELELLAPIDGRTEVWACGVTYERSRTARVEESERSPDVYEQVYGAPRPELFFKAPAWRVVGDGGTVGVRADSTVDVPEPELALVVNASGEIVGFTICDDVSSRSIEGENPLYLPQAKCYFGSCALGPAIRPAFEIGDPYSLGIRLEIAREGRVVWQGEASTAQLHRRFEELVDHLFRAERHPDGAVLSTGTCLVPELPFSLDDGDLVRIEVDGLGVLTTAVARGIPRRRDPS